MKILHIACGLTLIIPLGASAASQTELAGKGLASYDPQTRVLELPEVVVSNQRYAVRLTQLANGRFAITSADLVSTPIAAAPANYLTSSASLDVPKVYVAGQYYSAALRNTGDFVFELTSAAETSPVSNMTAWTQTGFRTSAPAQPRHVNRILVAQSGRIHATWYSQENRAYVAYTDDGGTNWKHQELERMLQVHQLIQLQDGTLVAGGQAFGTSSLIWYSTDDGLTWKQGASGLPNSTSEMVWDIAEHAGEAIITTSSETNDPTRSHNVVYAWNPGTGALRSLAPLPGIGALAIAVNSDGTIFVSTQESAEHDDATTAGQGKVFRSSDGGSSWTQTGTLTSANRVYALSALADGSVVAGSGLNGGFYRTVDGQNWTKMSVLPAGTKNFGNPPVPTEFPVTRVYKILELASGALLAGTGNDTGEIFLTCDYGSNWIRTAATGSNIVVWGLAQETNGTLWTGNGSVQGDVWKAVAPSGVSARQHYTCY